MNLNRLLASVAPWLQRVNSLLDGQRLFACSSRELVWFVLYMQQLEFFEVARYMYRVCPGGEDAKDKNQQRSGQTL